MEAAEVLHHSAVTSVEREPQPWHVTVAIDGPAGAGKGELAKAISWRHQLEYIDSGKFVRGLAYLSAELGITPESVERSEEDFQIVVETMAAMDVRMEQNPDADFWVTVNGVELSNELQTDEISILGSKFAAIWKVQEQFIAKYRSIAADHPVVIDGRFTGPVILPESEIMIYLDAHPLERARRRCAQLGYSDNPEVLAQTLTSIQERDRRDLESGLLVEDDRYVHIDTTHLTRAEVLTIVEETVERAHFGVH